MSLTPFQNETYVNFNDPQIADKMHKALALVKEQLGAEYPLVIGDDFIKTTNHIRSINPAKPSDHIGTTGKADANLADKAIQVANETFKLWQKVLPDERARYLFKAAAIIRRRYYEFCAWLCFEISKSWIEAYAEVAECIDFLEFYGREMMRLGTSQPTTPYPGEENEVRYIPLGVGVVISPWNFPLAILAGMTCAALVAGNTVVLKPASSAPIIAHKFFEVLIEAGLPAGVVNLVTGSGAEVGDTLVAHPLTRFVAFTGSKDVGLGIYELAGKHQAGQKWLKRSILEMGGKDCIAVDSNADIPGAIEAVVASAFGFQGQKCSACSRLIAHEKVYDALVEAISERVKNIKVGNPTIENVDMGAIIDTPSFKKINDYISIGKSEGQLVARSESGDGIGYYIPATFIIDVDRNARIAQEEIFGPVLSAIKVKDFDDLMDAVNGTEYGLTGSLFSNNRHHIEKARWDFHVGNFYINRKCTGALVDVQPFGGFNMSGTDSKAGGRDYLQLFMQAKTISERF